MCLANHSRTGSSEERSIYVIGEAYHSRTVVSVPRPPTTSEGIYSPLQRGGAGGGAVGLRAPSSSTPPLVLRLIRLLDKNIKNLRIPFRPLAWYAQRGRVAESKLSPHALFAPTATHSCRRKGKRR